jgi:ParB family chromosome partitioning protein
MKRFKFVPNLKIDEIYIGLANVRKKNIEEGIDELMRSIEEIGLMQPIVVVDRGRTRAGRYEVIIGQRRFLAFKKLKKSTIPALITTVDNETQASILSFSENIHRLDLDQEDKTQIALKLLADLNSVKKVADKLGVSTQTIRRWLGYQGVPDEIREMVGKGIGVQTAINIAKAIPDKKTAIEIAKRVKETPDNKTRKAILRVARESPTKKASEIIAKAKKLRTSPLTLNLTPNVATALKKASEKTKSSRETIAIEALENWLRKMRFL